MILESISSTFQYFLFNIFKMSNQELNDFKSHKVNLNPEMQIRMMRDFLDGKKIISDDINSVISRRIDVSNPENSFSKLIREYSDKLK